MKTTPAHAIDFSDRTSLKIKFLTSEKGDLPWESPRLERCWIEASVVSLLLFWRAEDHPLSLISEGAPRRARSPATPEIFWPFDQLRRGPPMDQDDDAEDEGAIAGASAERETRSKRTEAQDRPVDAVHVTQIATQPDDFAPELLESGASKLDDICPELLDHLRPVASFCPESRLKLIVVLRTFVTNKKPRPGRLATDLLVDMVGKESGLAGHRASRVAGLLRQMGTLEEMTADIRSLFSEPAAATAASVEATTSGVSDATLHRALASWAWAVANFW